MSSAPNPTITLPKRWFGFRPGDDRKLISWARMREYFQHIAGCSQRVTYEELGTVSGDLPMVQLTITSPGNMARLDTLQDIQRRLADPRITDHTEAEALAERGRTIVLLTCGIHATEVGSTQMTPELVYELATSTSPRTLQILDNVILLVVPCLNPWGMELVHDWYRQTLGTVAEGTPPPSLYHPYAGHDNNRDWFMLTQAENRVAVERIHNVWHPHIVVDQHQMMNDGPRYVLPPFIDPHDPNVDPLLQAETAQLGHAISAELIAAGKRGVATNAIFDAFSPSRAYQHYHGGVRILSEAAGCRIASPVELERSEIRDIHGFDPLVRQSNNPYPWEGGPWHLRDIVDYNKIAVYACLRNAAVYRHQWLRNFHTIQQQSVEMDTPFAWIIPPEQRDPGAVVDLLRVLDLGMVEIATATTTFKALGERFPAGSKIIYAGQPFGRYAKTLLERQTYPAPARNATGPPHAPYDITAHSLTLYLGVDVREAATPFRATTRRITRAELERPRGAVTGTAGEFWRLHANQNSSFMAVNRLLAARVPVWRANSKYDGTDGSWPAGTFLARTDDLDLLTHVARVSGAQIMGVSGDSVGECRPIRSPRIGLYRSWVPNAIDEGWTRFIFESYCLPFTTLRDRDIRQGGLNRYYDCIILPHQVHEDLMFGNSPAEYPAKYAGGIGERGAGNLRRFVEAGGTLITLDGACELALRYLFPPVINVLDGLTEDEYDAPGVLLKLDIDVSHPIGWGYENGAAGLVTGHHAFSVAGTRNGAAIAEFSGSAPILSGWMRGQERLQDAAALVDVSIERGHAILFGFRPQFRAQTRGTYRLLFNAIYYAAMGDPA